MPLAFVAHFVIIEVDLEVIQEVAAQWEEQDECRLMRLHFPVCECGEQA